MAHKRPGVFKGQVRGVSHQGQEKTLHLKAEYIDADFLHSKLFPCIHTADHTFGKFTKKVENHAAVVALVSSNSNHLGGRLRFVEGLFKLRHYVCHERVRTQCCI